MAYFKQKMLVLSLITYSNIKCLLYVIFGAKIIMKHYTQKEASESLTKVLRIPLEQMDWLAPNPLSIRIISNAYTIVNTFYNKNAHK